MSFWGFEKVDEFGVNERQGGHHDYNLVEERWRRYRGEVEEGKWGWIERVDGDGISLVSV